MVARIAIAMTVEVTLEFPLRLEARQLIFEEGSCHVDWKGATWLQSSGLYCEPMITASRLSSI
jgi:hypothetical protein